MDKAETIIFLDMGVQEAKSMEDQKQDRGASICCTRAAKRNCSKAKSDDKVRNMRPNAAEVGPEGLKTWGLLTVMTENKNSWDSWAPGSNKVKEAVLQQKIPEELGT